jgi:hypothetical protein
VDVPGARVRSLLSWLPVLVASGAVAALDAATADPADLPYFLHAARTLLSGDWLQTFADPDLQVGPLQLLVLGLGERLADGLGVAPLGFLALALEVGLVALLLLVLGRLLRGRPRARIARLLIGAAAVAAGLCSAAFDYGHPAQVATPLLWILAALDAREGRTLRAGGLLGVTAGFEAWGVLGAPVLLLDPRLRRAAVGLAVQAVVTVALYAPFALGGSFRMLDHEWRVEPWAPVARFVDPGSPFPWTLRVVQGAAAVVVGAVAARSLARLPAAVWLVPLAVVGVRLALDPTLYPWYWIGLETIVLVGAAALTTGDLLPLVRRTSRSEPPPPRPAGLPASAPPAWSQSRSPRRRGRPRTQG